MFVALVLGVVSCQNYLDDFDVNIGSEKEVVVSVSLPESTRANSAVGAISNEVVESDEYTLRYIFQIWDEAKQQKKDAVVEYSDDTTISFPVRLVPGRNYRFVVWADVVREDKKKDLHYNTANFPTISVNTDSWLAMDETRDAYTASELITDFGSAQNYTLTLKRPFAKLRVITTDMDELMGVTPTSATVTYTTEHYNTFNALESKAVRESKNENKEHEDYTIKKYELTNGKVLFTDYFFAENDVVSFNLSVNMSDNGEPITRNFNTDIPVNRNHLTTLIGNILTEGDNIEVKIEEGFGGEIEEVYPPVNIDPNRVIRYTATEKVVPYKTNAFGANIVSNTWNETTGEGYITFDNDVTIIDEWAFQNCDFITSIVIPSSVTIINDSAFTGCDNLEIVTLPNNLEVIGERAFYGCGLTSITFPDSLTTIGDVAFNGCENLTSVTIPDSVVNMGSSVFNRCYNITEFKGKYSDCNNSCLIIGDVFDAYAAASNATEFTIPSHVKKIEGSAFAHSVNLEHIVIPNSVIEIGWESFNECSNLKQVEIPNSVKSIGYYAFRNCSNLTHVVFPDSIDSCWDTMFNGCNKLEGFSGAYAANNGKCLMIPEYNNCIVGFAPAGLTEYTLPLDANRVCSYFDSKTLNTLTIPASVYELCSNTFYNCDNLTTIYCRAIVPPTIDGTYTKPFAENVVGRTIYVPFESVDVYKVEWSMYANDIVGYDFNKEIIYSAKSQLTSRIVNNASSHTWNNELGIGVIRFDETVTTIEPYAFASNNITSINLPDTVTTIGNYAFYYCPDLTDVYMGECVSHIGGGAFFMCKELKNINIPDTLETIDGAAFAECKSLISITLPENIQSIGIQAFRDCDRLSTMYCMAITPPEIRSLFYLNIPANFTIYVPASSYWDYVYAEGWSSYKDHIVAYDFENNCIVATPAQTKPARNEIWYTSLNEEVIEPNNTSAFGANIVSNTYENGKGVIKFDGEVTEIGDYAFGDSSYLSEIIIPSTVTNIGNTAFYNCMSLCRVDLWATIPPTMGWDTFFWCSNIVKIYVPVESLDAYLANDYWRSIGTVIFGR